MPNDDDHFMRMSHSESTNKIYKKDNNPLKSLMCLKMAFRYLNKFYQLQLFVHFTNFHLCDGVFAEKIVDNHNEVYSELLLKTATFKINSETSVQNFYTKDIKIS